MAEVLPSFLVNASLNAKFNSVHRRSVTVARICSGVTDTDMIVDAMRADVVRDPACSGVIVATNICAGILSDLSVEAA
jgi:isocitrate/isopropylmalate dehydrogenase